jgi:HSP20 family protein
MREINKCEHKITPAADIYEDDNSYTLKAEMPGVNKDNLDVNIDNGLLVINGKINNSPESDDLKYQEYKLNDYCRSFKVGNNIDTNKVSANLKNGVLTLVLPKSEHVKPKKIEIKASA